MKNAKELRKLIEIGEINITDLSAEEINALVDEILENFDAESVSDIELLSQCYDVIEASEEISSERYSQLVSEIVDAHNESYAKPPKMKKRIIILVAAAIFILATLGGCRIFDFSVNGLGGWEIMNNLPEQEKVSHDNVDIIWTDNTRIYDSVEELIEKEDITDIVCLKKLPEGFKLTFAKYIELGENDLIDFYYDCEGTQIILNIEKNRTPNLPIESFDEVYSAYGIDFGCLFNRPDGNTYAFWNYGEDTYILQVKGGNAELLKEALYALEPCSADAE